MSLTQKYAKTFSIIPKPQQKGFTSSFVTTSRDRKSMFENRYTREFNDLQYSTTHNKKAPTHTTKPSNFSLKNLNETQKNSSSGFSKRQFQPAQIVQLKKNKSQKDFYIRPQKKIENQKERKEELLQGQSDLNKKYPKPIVDKFGLSPFEYDQTISGKVHKKQASNLCFQNCTNRPNYENKVWYQKDTIFSALDREQQNQKKKSVHHFKSYSSHSVFKPAQHLDKFYNVSESAKQIQPRRDIKIRLMNKVKSRDDLPKKQGTNLDYCTISSLISKKMPLFRIARTERKLTISKEIISPERGCFR